MISDAVLSCGSCHADLGERQADHQQPEFIPVVQAGHVIHI